LTISSLCDKFKAYPTHPIQEEDSRKEEAMAYRLALEIDRDLQLNLSNRQWAGLIEKLIESGNPEKKAREMLAAGRDEVLKEVV
jgi:hypothetical protein